MNDAIVEKLNGFLSLEKNGAQPINPRCVNLATLLVRCLELGKLSVVPTVQGGVQLEWRHESDK